MKIIAKIHTDLPEKFGVPRQSGVVEELTGRIVFEPEFRVKEAIEGIEDFSHLWLLWQFSENVRDSWSPTVRPPRLGGEIRKGVFATRSPFRPNPIGLSCVKLIKVEHTKQYGYTLIVSGVDLMDNTPIFDIKPYIAYTDSKPNANEGFANAVKDYSLKVEFPAQLLMQLPADKQEIAIKLLKQDPRPAYHNDPDRIYGMKYAGHNIKFKVIENKLIVTEIEKS